MLKKNRFNILRFLILWIVPAVSVGTIMYIFSKLIYLFKWGNNWHSNRYYSWLYFMGMTWFIFLFVALIYVFIYWFLSTQLLIPLNSYKKTFQIIWATLFGLSMSLFVVVNSFGSISFFDFLKIMIIMTVIGWLIPFLDIKLKKYKNIIK